MSRLPLLPLLLILSCTALTSCNLIPYKRQTLVLATDPPGASIWIDGEESGWVTPATLDLPECNDYGIEFRYPGYQSEARYLDNDGYWWSMLWREMYTHEGTWRFPFWLGIGDFFIPFKRTRFQSPSRVFIELRRQADIRT